MPPNRLRRRPKKNQGQVAIMMAVMIFTFLFFFRFVVNTGLLVNAKINLQNAADLAAYAGAASQARILNSISFLNYEMRRQYKKFLFRYYVLGNLSQEGFPNNGPGETYNFAPKPGVTPYGVPAVCIIFNNNDNYCQVAVNPKISNVPINPLDPISISLNQTLQALEQIRQEQCGGISTMNQILLGLWLYNADPTLENIEARLSGPNATPQFLRAVRSIRGLGQGLGLYPKELLLLQRIRTLASYLNLPANKDGTGELTLEDIQDLEATEFPFVHERKILAFRSAYKTLGEHMFNAGSIRLKELLPAGDNATNLFDFEPLVANFEAYSVHLKNVDGNCRSEPTPVKVRQVPLGVAKNPEVLTYYALRLEAEAEPLFSFLGEPIKLRAYAAAQPFGSRIGPTSQAFLSANPFVNVGKKPSSTILAADAEGVPNLAMAEGDSPSGGWYRKDVLRAMRSKLLEGVQGLSLNNNDYERGYANAMAPNPTEQGLYNIVSDLGEDPEDALNISAGDPFVKYFEEGSIFDVWAPLAGDTTDTAQLTQELADAIRNNAPGGKDFTDALISSVSTYLGSLGQGQGEDGESLNIIRLRNPYRSDTNAGPDQPLNHAFVTRDLAAIKSSWSDLKDENLASRFRTGYSVKLVSFPFLLGSGAQTANDDSGSTWSNFPDLDQLALQEIGEKADLIRH